MSYVQTEMMSANQSAEEAYGRRKKQVGGGKPEP